MSLTFLVGGARSGKSTLSTRLASEQDRPVTLIATAEARDDDMSARIARHRAERPPGWTTIEVPLALRDAVTRLEPDAFVIVDCLTLWVSNALEDGWDDEAIVRTACDITAALAQREAPSIVVSNEVGLGIVPMNELARRYRDVLGRVNAATASRADRSFLVVAGRALALAELP